MMTAPLTNRDSSPARNSATFAMSSGIPGSGEWTSRELVRPKPNSDEFDASGRLLLNGSADHYLTIEDAVTAGSILLDALELARL